MTATVPALYVLILILNGSSGQVSATTAEFQNRAACETAGRNAVALGATAHSSISGVYVCSPKQ